MTGSPEADPAGSVTAPPQGVGPLLPGAQREVRPLRQQILEHVRAQGRVARAEISRALGISAGSVTTLTSELIAMGLLHLSDYYSIDGLKRSCGDYLFRLLGKDQLPALLTIADEYSVRHLRQRCACVLADDFEELLEQGTLWTLSIEVWAELLNQTELAVSDEGTAATMPYPP